VRPRRLVGDARVVVAEVLVERVCLRAVAVVDEAGGVPLVGVLDPVVGVAALDHGRVWSPSPTAPRPAPSVTVKFTTGGLAIVMPVTSNSSVSGSSPTMLISMPPGAPSCPSCPSSPSIPSVPSRPFAPSLPSSPSLHPVRTRGATRRRIARKRMSPRLFMASPCVVAFATEGAGEPGRPGPCPAASAPPTPQYRHTSDSSQCVLSLFTVSRVAIPRDPEPGGGLGGGGPSLQVTAGVTPGAS